VRLNGNKRRQTVTGLTVNEQCNVPRRFVRQVRAMIYAWATIGHKLAGAEHAAKYYGRRGRKGDIPPIESIIRGKLEFVKMVRGVDDPVYRNLQTQFLCVCPAYFDVMREENEAMNHRDFFISHASEDKDAIARPLAHALIAAGFTVWFDEYEIRIGDSIRKKIDEGLVRSTFGIVILSTSFFATKKLWTQREVDGLTAREDADGKSRILPIWHRITQAEVASVSPTLAGLRALLAEGKSVEEMVGELSSVFD
jgi:hypothetical protein